MHDLLTPARFEFRYHSRQPIFYGLLLLIGAQGAATGAGLVAQLADFRLHTNAPVLLYAGFANPGPLLVAALALLTGQTLLRDRDHRVGTYLYALPIEPRSYFMGQFLGTLGIGGLLGISYTLGLLTTPLWVRGSVGAFPLLPLLDGFIRLLLPNVLLVVCLSFALTALLRHIAGAYLTLLTLLVGSTLLQLGYAAVVDLDWAHLLDPFGGLSIRQAVDAMTTADKNEGLPDFPAMLYINRLLWLGLSGWLLTRADAQLTFAYWLDLAPRRAIPQWLSVLLNRFRAIVRANETRLEAPALPDWVRVRPAPLTGWQSVRLAARLAWGNARWLLRQPAVLVGLLLLVLGIAGYALGLGNTDSEAITPSQRLLPFTSRLTFVRLPMHLFISLFLILFTGELLHRERTSGLWLLTDATPQPTWVLLLGKAGALLLLAISLTGTLLLTGLVLQGLNGQTPIDLSLYAADLLGDGLLRYVQLIGLAVLVHAVLTNRLLGHLLLVIGLAGATYLENQSDGLATYLYTYLPGSWAYSDLTGYGNLAAPRLLLALGWTFAGAALLLIATRLGQRGNWVSGAQLVARFRRGLTATYLSALVMLLVAGGGCLFWAGQARQPGSASLIAPYNTVAQQVIVGRQRVNVLYHFVHPQNQVAMEAVVARAIRQGTAWLGPFPAGVLHITETPFNAPTVPAQSGQIRLSEREGWMTDTTRRRDAGLLDMAVTRQVLNQWLAVSFSATRHPSGLLTDGLATYLATRIVQAHRGNDWLATQLALFTDQYRRGRGRTTQREPTPEQAPAGSYVAEARAPLSLTCVGEVWGHDNLCRQIGQFYQTHQQRSGTSPTAYLHHLQQALPDTFRPIVQYLTSRPAFSFSLGAVGLRDDRISVQVVAHKALDDGLGNFRDVLLADYVPVVVLNERGQILHRELIQPYTAGRADKFFWLPSRAGATSVAIDPLGSWPESNRTDNRKTLPQGVR